MRFYHTPISNCCYPFSGKLAVGRIDLYSDIIPVQPLRHHARGAAAGEGVKYRPTFRASGQYARFHQLFREHRKMYALKTPGAYSPNVTFVTKLPITYRFHWPVALSGLTRRSRLLLNVLRKPRLCAFRRSLPDSR